MIPALLISTSRRPVFSTMVSTAASQLTSLVTSSFRASMSSDYASLGVAMSLAKTVAPSLENSSANVDMLLDCADQALYAAKQGGRNQVRIFRGGLQSNLVLPFDR